MPDTDSHIVLGLAEQKNFFSELLPRVQATADEVKKIVEGYDCLVEQCRKKFGTVKALLATTLVGDQL